MSFGNMPNDGGNLLLSCDEADEALTGGRVPARFIRPFLGSEEFIRGIERRCVWVADDEYEIAQQNNWLYERFVRVQEKRSASDRATTRALAAKHFKLGEDRQSKVGRATGRERGGKE